MSDLGTVVLIDADVGRKAALSRMIMELGLHAEPFDNALEFLKSRVNPSIVLCADEGRAMSSLANHRSESGRHFSVIAYRENPDTRDVVTAMRMGVDDYLDWPMTEKSLQYRLQNVARTTETLAPLKRRISEARARMELLTSRERQVMKLITDGFSTKETARELGISPRTVEIHRANVSSKTKTRNTAHLVRLCVEGGLDIGHA